MGSLSGAVGQALTVPCRTLGETDLLVSYVEVPSYFAYVNSE
jgi:hypothetical protein